MEKFRPTLAFFVLASLALPTIGLTAQKPSQESTDAAQRQAQIVAQQDAFEECKTLHAHGRKDEALANLAAIVVKNPSMDYTADVMRLGWLATDDRKAWEKKIVSMSKSNDLHKVSTVGMFAWGEACSPSGSKLLAVKAVDVALEATNRKDVTVLFWAVMVDTKTGDYDDGLDSVNTLFKLLPSSSQKNNATLIKQMEEKRTELRAKVKAEG